MDIHKNDCISVCLSSMHHLYIIRPIAIKIWEVFKYTPAKVFGVVFFSENSLPKGEFHFR